MVEAGKHLTRRHGWREEDVMVWVDYISVPVRHPVPVACDPLICTEVPLARAPDLYEAPLASDATGSPERLSRAPLAPLSSSPRASLSCERSKHIRPRSSWPSTRCAPTPL